MIDKLDLVVAYLESQKCENEFTLDVRERLKKASQLHRGAGAPTWSAAADQQQNKPLPFTLLLLQEKDLFQI